MSSFMTFLFWCRDNFRSVINTGASTKDTSMHQLISIFLALASLLGISAEQNEIKTSSLPDALLYMGNPIPDPILMEFFGLAVLPGELEDVLDIPKSIEEYAQKQSCPEECEDPDYCPPKVSFEWEYIGSPYKDVHAVWAYWWEEGCMGKFTGILLLKRNGDALHIVDIIFGGDRHSSMIFNGHIHENMIVYSQGATTAAIVDIALEEHPELIEVYHKSSRNGICYGEAGYFGCFEMVANIDPSGKIKEIVRTGFTPCEGFEGKELEEIYRKDGFKGLALVLLDNEEEKGQ